MSTPARFDVRLFLIQLTANANLVLAGLLILFGAWVLIAGADTIAALGQLKETVTATIGDAKPAAGTVNAASDGLAGFAMAMAGLIAGCAALHGLPHLLIGIGIFYRNSLARIFALIFGALALLEGLALIGSRNATRGLILFGVGLVLYGVLSWVALLGRRAADYFARRDLAPDASGAAPLAASPLSGRLALVGTLVLLASFCLAAYLEQAPTSRADEVRLQGVWAAQQDTRDAHEIVFAKDGVFYHTSQLGTAKGTYQLINAQTLEFAYEVPEELYQLQKRAFDAVKKAAEAPENPLKGVLSAVEPLRSVKARVGFTFEQGDKVLRLHHDQQVLPYHRSEVGLKAFEKKLSKQAARAAAPATVKAPAPDETAGRYKVRLTALLDAIQKGQTSRAKELLQEKNGPSANDRDDEGETPLMKAVQSGYIDMVLLLLAHGGDWTRTDKDGNHLLMHAAVRGKLQWLVQRMGTIDGSPAPYKDRDGNSNFFDWLKGCWSTRNQKGMNAFMLAAAHGQLHDLKHIYSCQLPFSAGNAETVKGQFLLLTDHAGKTAFDHAQAKEQKEVLAWLQPLTGQQLLAAPPPPPEKLGDWKPSTVPEEIAFLKACQAGEVEAVDRTLKAALEKDATGAALLPLLLARDVDGLTPLMHAAAKGEATLVLLLCQRLRERSRQSNVHALDKQQRTALHHAAQGGYTAVLDPLCKLALAGWEHFSLTTPDPRSVHWFQCLHQRDASGKTALELADAGGHKPTAAFLKKQYTDQFTTPSPGAGSLMVLELACQEGDVATVAALLKMECPHLVPGRDYKQGSFSTPLHHAAKKGHLLVAKTLLDGFIDRQKRQEFLAISAPYTNGNLATALQMAEGSGHREVADLLRQYTAK